MPWHCLRCASQVPQRCLGAVLKVHSNPLTISKNATVDFCKLYRFLGCCICFLGCCICLSSCCVGFFSCCIDCCKCCNPVFELLYWCCWQLFQVLGYQGAEGSQGPQGVDTAKGPRDAVLQSALFSGRTTPKDVRI